ncbi:MAG: glycine dehydrogenase (aminomethyl-transferring) [Spirochaetaceae bacterium 4572_59]|nr:MAG: glycine dehydrogenase (aminomethyl-transferring) [Spirochaetaceae bacterium 4572_59]
MASYTPHTRSDREKMMEFLGIDSLDELFQAVPPSYRYPELSMDKGRCEQAVLKELRSMADKNSSAAHTSWFLGGGVYNHYIPSVVDSIISRGEFFTAYTPYQPEVSQGSLQAIFEFQTMIAELYGMDVVNASHYDGATAMAEAALMALRCRSGRKKIILDEGIHPEYREVLETYLSGSEGYIARGECDDETACFITAFPSFRGELKDLKALGEKVHARGALFIVNADPLACGLFTPPGECGADIVTGEGQPLGIAMNSGGPLLGLFATSKKLIRKMPGRVIGQTSDGSGRPGCVLTFSAREQHIRREKATSNICSNQGLMALAAAVYMAALGKQGIRDTARLCYDKALYAARQINSLKGYSVDLTKAFFREFVVTCPMDADILSANLREKDIVAGLPLGCFEGGNERELLVCVTEMNEKEEIDRLVNAMKEAL